MKFHFFLVLLLCMVACKPSGPIEVHKKRMDDTTFVSVMTELLVLEGIHTQTFRRSNVPEELYGAFHGIFDRHQTTAADWDTTLQYYLSNPELLMGVYDSVLVRLPRLKSVYRTQLDSGLIQLKKENKKKAKQLKEGPPSLFNMPPTFPSRKKRDAASSPQK